MPGWAALDDESARLVETQPFSTSTPYRLTSFRNMATQWLTRCPPELTSGRMTIRQRAFRLACAP